MIFLPENPNQIEKAGQLTLDKRFIGFLLVIFFLYSGQTSLYSELSTPKFQHKNNVIQSKTGYFTLTWGDMGKKNVTYLLQQSSHPGFQQVKTIYQGPDLGTFLSGYPEGTFYFRVRSINDKTFSKWSSPIKLVVKYQSITMAWILFAMGGMVFISIVAVIIIGNRMTNIE